MVEDKGDSIEVQSNAAYSKFLEYGTSKMEARPFLFPAYEMSRQKIVDAIFKRVVRTIQDLAT